MRLYLFTQILLLCAVAAGSDKPASCKLAAGSIVGFSSGVAQVSNVGDIQISCRVPARPFPSKPGETRWGLRPKTSAYLLASDGTKTFVESEARSSGGGNVADGGEAEQEYVDFYVHIPLDPTERDDEAGRFLAKFENSSGTQLPPESNREEAVKRIGKLIYQHRVGHFQLNFNILDVERVVGVSVIELEVVFVGRFSDIGLPSAPPL